MADDTTIYYCSFCGKDNRRDKAKLIAGPTVFICYECVDLCVDVKAARTSLPRFPPVSMIGAAHLSSILKETVDAANRAIERLDAYREELEKCEREP